MQETFDEDNEVIDVPTNKGVSRWVIKGLKKNIEICH